MKALAFMFAACFASGAMIAGSIGMIIINFTRQITLFDVIFCSFIGGMAALGFLCIVMINAGERKD